MSFDSLWNSSETFNLPETPPNTCAYAQKFSTWVEELLTRDAKEPSIVFINQAKVLLLDKYFEWRSVVPKRHRTRLGHLGHHQCISQVFEEAYERLKATELTLMPPLLFLPPPPSSPPMAQIAGIFLGQREKQSDGSPR